MFSLIILSFTSQICASFEDGNIVKVDVVSDWDGVSDRFYLGVRFSISPGWYIYWRNPGDAGLAPEMRISLPRFFKAEDVKFPIPKKIVHEGVTSFGYYEEVVLLIPVHIASVEAVRKQNVFKIQINWLACNKSCVPGNATVEYRLKKANSSERNLIKKYKDMLPKNFNSSGLAIKRFEIEKKGSSRLISVEFSGKNVDKIQDFYPDLIGKFLIDLESVRIKNGKLEMRATPMDANAELNFLSGILVVNNVGYELNLKQK